MPIEQQERGHAAACLELACTAQQLIGASINHYQDGSTFGMWCGSLSGAEVAGLEHAVHAGMSVRLVFPESAVLLSRVKVEQVDGWARIEGFVIGSAPDDGARKEEPASTGSSTSDVPR